NDDASHLEACIGSDDQPEHQHALKLRSARFLRMLVMGGVNGALRADSPADVVGSTANACAGARSNPLSVSRTHAAAGATSNAAAKTGPIREWRHDVREWVAHLSSLRLMNLGRP